MYGVGTQDVFTVFTDNIWLEKGGVVTAVIENNPFPGSTVKSLLVYPNSASGSFTVSSDVMIEKVEIFNLLGNRVLVQQAHTGNEIIIDALDAGYGLFIVKVTTVGNNIRFGKVMIR